MVSKKTLATIFCIPAGILLTCVVRPGQQALSYDTAVFANFGLVSKGGAAPASSGGDTSGSGGDGSGDDYRRRRHSDASQEGHEGTDSLPPFIEAFDARLREDTSLRGHNVRNAVFHLASLSKNLNTMAAFSTSHAQGSTYHFNLQPEYDEGSDTYHVKYELRFLQEDGRDAPTWRVHRSILSFGKDSIILRMGAISVHDFDALNSIFNAGAKTTQTTFSYDSHQPIYPITLAFEDMFRSLCEQGSASAMPLEIRGVARESLVSRFQEFNTLGNAFRHAQESYLARRVVNSYELAMDRAASIAVGLIKRSLGLGVTESEPKYTVA